MNIIDSIRELVVLTIAGIVVYKLDHKELRQWMAKVMSDDKTETKELKKLEKEMEEVKSNG